MAMGSLVLVSLAGAAVKQVNQASINSLLVHNPVQIEKVTSTPPVSIYHSDSST